MAELAHLANVVYQITVNITESCLLAENCMTGQAVDAMRAGPQAVSRFLDQMKQSAIRNMVAGVAGRVHGRTSKITETAVKISATMLGVTPCQKDMDSHLYSDKVAWYAFGPGHHGQNPDGVLQGANWHLTDMRSREGMHAHGYGQVVSGPHIIPPRVLNALLYEKASGDAYAATPWLCQPLHHSANTVHLGEWRRCNASREMQALGLRWSDADKRELLASPMDLKMSTALFARGVQEAQFGDMLESGVVRGAATYATYQALVAATAEEDITPGSSMKFYADGYRVEPTTPWNKGCVDRNDPTASMKCKLLLMTEVPKSTKDYARDNNEVDEICGRPPILENSLFSICLYTGHILAPEIRRQDAEAWDAWASLVLSLPCDNQDAKYRPTKIFSPYVAHLVDAGQSVDTNALLSMFKPDAAQPTI